MDDFPWSWWVHGGNTTCKGTMRMYSTGNTSTLADMWVECSCGARRSMSGATQHENFEGMKCSGHHPFRLNHKNEKCDKEMIPSQRGASNVYFPVMRSAISIPPWINPLSVCGIEIYACLRDESGYQTKKIRATDKLLSSTKDKVAGFINCTYLADDAEFDTSENIADNKKEFYEISLIENYRPFTFLDDAEKRTEYYSESDRNKLSGFLFRINLNDKYFWVYQHIYSVSRIDRSKNIIALFVGDTYDEIDSDIVQIDSRADVIIFSSSVVTAKMDLMQRFFGFEQYIRAGAQKTIEIIRDLDIVDSLEKFVAFENKSKLTNAKKLLKAKNSPVLQMKKNDLLENLKKHSRYKTMFKFEEDHIVISSQKEAAAFIKMLNDDIVRSELTGKEYDSSSKMLLGPVGASH
ncbi:DUF4868 domain-containing protein [Blautia sp. NSJ-140]|uniref:DUF4868 domain-containing protein n=1 Tax=Blautia sp. NSJ-140 TaxID=2931395 RepID=UPI001FD130CA|nr:DUF4868 domain-containing protein [Blautia sp. NSJ-140]MCJ7865015.1 DUF4868 domain-containing protein [Blautia sp. NSJ-140]